MKRAQPKAPATKQNADAPCVPPLPREVYIGVDELVVDLLKLLDNASPQVAAEIIAAASTRYASEVENADGGFAMMHGLLQDFEKTRSKSDMAECCKHLRRIIKRDARQNFIDTWQHGSCLDDVADALGMSSLSAKHKASALRRQGVNLKKFPRGFEAALKARLRK